MRKKNSYSRIVQAVFNWTNSGNTASEKGKLIRLLHHCIENDITSFDCTSPSGKAVERTFGTSLSESGLSRDEIQLVAKLKNSPEKDLISGVDELLLNARTDYLDLLLLEHPNQMEKVKNDIEKLSSQGKIMEVGSFNLQESEIVSFKNNFPLSANFSQLSFSASEENLKISEEFSEEVVQMVAFEPAEASQTSKNGILKELSEKYDVNEPQLLLSWLLNHPSHLHPVISFTTEEEITGAAAAKEVTIDPVDWQKTNFLLK